MLIICADNCELTLFTTLLVSYTAERVEPGTAAVKFAWSYSWKGLGVWMNFQ